VRTFKDNTGREWTVEITYDEVCRVHEWSQPASDAALQKWIDGGKHGKQPPGPIDIGFPLEGDPPLATRLMSDKFLLAHVIFIVMQPQIEASGIQPEELRRHLGGAALTAMFTAFWGAVSDFIRDAGDTAGVKLIETNLNLVQAAMKLMDSKMGQIDVEGMIQKLDAMIDVEAEMTKAMNEVRSNSAVSAPESAVLVPTE